MNIKDILKSIYEGLSGDALSDLNYLKDLATMYKGHKYEVEITRELGRIFYEIVSREQTPEAFSFYEDLLLGVNDVLSEVEDLLEDQNFNEALNKMEDLVKRYEEIGGFFDDEVSEFRCFREPIEEIIYIGLNEVEKEVRGTPEDYAYMYKVYGNILFELENFKEAQQAYEKSLHLNPMDFEVRCEYIRSFNFLNDNESFLTKTKEAIDYAYKSDQLSYLFMNLGFYYWNEMKYDISTTCLYGALSFDKENEQAKEMLATVMEESGKQWPYPSSEMVKTLFDKYDIPKAPNRKLLQVLHAYIQKYRYESCDLAYYVCEYLYDLTKMDSIKKIMEEIQKNDYVDISNVNEENLKDGSIVKSIIRRYMRVPNEDNLYDLLYTLEKCTVIVPTINEDLEYEDGMKADLLRSDDGRLHFPVFTSKEEMPFSYASKFSRTHVRFVDCIESAKRNHDVASIVINPFSGAVELNFDQLRMIEGINNNTMN